MHPALATHAPSSNHTELVPPPSLPVMPGSAVGRRNPTPNSLLKPEAKRREAVEASTDVETQMDLDTGAGVFLGLRFALLFNVGLGIAGMMVYEAWSILAR